MVMLIVLAFEWMFHETACANNEKQKQISEEKKTRKKMRENFNGISLEVGIVCFFSA